MPKTFGLLFTGTRCRPIGIILSALRDDDNDDDDDMDDDTESNAPGGVYLLRMLICVDGWTSWSFPLWTGSLICI